MIESPDSTRNFRGDILFAFTLALGCYAAWLLRDFLVLLYVSGLFAVVLTPVVRLDCRAARGALEAVRGWALLVLLLAVAGGLALFGFLALPPVIADLQEFAGEMPARMPVLLEKLKHIPFADQINTGEITSRVEGFVSEAATYLSAVDPKLGGQAVCRGDRHRADNLFHFGGRGSLSLVSIVL